MAILDEKIAKVVNLLQSYAFLMKYTKKYKKNNKYLHISKKSSTFAPTKFDDIHNKDYSVV